MRTIILLLAVLLLAAGCGPTPNIAAITPPYIDTGVDPGAWALIPAGEFPFGQHDHPTDIEYDFEMMTTHVTNEQFAAFLNQALAAGAAGLGAVEVAAGETTWTEEGVFGHYPGDPFDGYKHEEEIRAGNKLYTPLAAEGTRLDFDGETFIAQEAYRNHPATMVTWFGANAYCEFYGWRLPAEVEWEKAARGPERIDGRGRAFPWGNEIKRNNANFYSSFDLFVKMFGKLGNTTPVGFYNGRTYDGGYQTLDSASPYGLYDMAGNAGQWVGDDHPFQHYRHIRGGSFYSYEVDLRTWKFNSAGPQYYSPAIGFRCARDIDSQ